MHPAACRDCRFFDGGPRALEQALPALAALSSANGAARADDGLCRQHDRHVRAGAHCAAFTRR